MNRGFVNTLEIMAIVAGMTACGPEAAPTPVKGDIIAFDRKALESPGSPDALAKIENSLDRVRDGCGAVGKFEDGSETVVVVRAGDEVFRYGLCRVNGRDYFYGYVPEDGNGKPVNRSIEIVEDNDAVLHGYRDAAGFHTLWMDTKVGEKYKTAATYVISPNGKYVQANEEQKGPFLEFPGVIVVEAAPADTDTPSAPTTTPTVEVTVRPSNTAEPTAVVSNETPVPTEAPKKVVEDITKKQFAEQKYGIMQQAGFDLKKIPVEGLPELRFGEVQDGKGFKLQTMSLVNANGDPILPLSVKRITDAANETYFVVLPYKTAGGEVGAVGMLISGAIDPVNWSVKIEEMMGGRSGWVLQLYTHLSKDKLSAGGDDWKNMMDGTSGVDGGDFSTPESLDGGVFSGGFSY